MNHDSYPDGYIRGILGSVRTIAMVGVSANTSRPSYFAFKYLLERGYRYIAAVDRWGNAAVDEARKKGIMDIVNMLSNSRESNLAASDAKADGRKTVNIHTDFHPQSDS